MKARQILSIARLLIRTCVLAVVFLGGYYLGAVRQTQYGDFDAKFLLMTQAYTVAATLDEGETARTSEYARNMAGTYLGQVTNSTL